MDNILDKASLVDVNMENIDRHPGIMCIINPKHPLYHKKLEWLETEYKRGLKTKLLYLEGEKRAVGFIEYVPGEHCYRSVSAEGYQFIHCLFINGKRFHNQGLGQLMIDAVEADALEMSGVAVITSDRSFMADRSIFLKSGYEVIDSSGKEQLMIKSFSDAPPPKINDWETQLKKYKSFHLVYSRQCPWVARAIDELMPVFEEENMIPEIIELKTPKEAQNAPSLYSVFTLIYKGKILSDRYVSKRRLSNIIQKEIKAKGL